MSTINGRANPDGDVMIPDGGMGGYNLYSNSAPVEGLTTDGYPMMSDDNIGQDTSAPPSAAPAPVPAPAPPPSYNFGASATSPRALIPALLGGVVGWCLGGDEPEDKAKASGVIAASVYFAAIAGDWISSQQPPSS